MAVATLCYYMQPVIVICLAPVVLGEKITARQMICVALSIIGMIFVSGVAGGLPGGRGAMEPEGFCWDLGRRFCMPVSF